MTIHNPPIYIPKGWPRLYYTITNFMRRLDMRLAKMFVMMLIVAVIGQAQGPGVDNPYQIRVVTSDPSGACPSAYFFQFNPTSGNFFGCKSGTWTQLNGGGGGGAVSSVSGDGLLITNSGSTGAVTLTLASIAKNLVFVGPASGSNATPTFRLLVGADLPNPSATTLGGVESIASASHNWIAYIDTSGVPHQSQPAFSDLSGSATCGQLPALTGDATTSAGSCATSVAQVNGAAVPASAKVIGSNSSHQLITAGLTSAHIYLGNGSNLPVDVAISGDISITNTGAVTVNNVNGVAYPASPSTNTVPVVTGSNTITYEAVPNAALANSSIIFANGTGISGAATVALGNTYTPAVTSNTRMRPIGAGFDGGGSALVTTGGVAYFTVPFACTISAWDITVDTGTITFDVWKIGTGTAIPTITNTITASALPAISSGTAVHSTTLTGWTTTVTADDIFAVVINTVASATKASLVLECATSS